MPFIFNSWLKSYRESFFARGITSTVYYNEHHKVIENLVSTCDTLVASNTNDPTDIYGFVCAEKIDGIFVLHYIYVKHTYRFLGLARLLVTQLEADFGKNAALYTHNTKVAERLAAKYNLIYSPYIALIPNYRKLYSMPGGDVFSQQNVDKKETESTDEVK